MKDIAADPVVAAEYRAQGWWGDRTLAQRVAELAAARPSAPAYITEAHVLTWAGYDRAAQRVASALVSIGLERGERVAVLLPDGASVHAAFVGIERAGLVIVGIGARAGEREVRHLLGLTGARALITHPALRDRPSTELVAALRGDGLPLDHHLVVGDFAVDPEAPLVLDGRLLDRLSSPPPDLARGPDELWLLNSTSGTTGLPKCVMHTQNRWWYFHQRAMISAEFTDDDIFFGAVPAPFGFGIWTAHASPTILGVPTLVTERFDADVALDLIAHHRVTALHCVSTQFIMLLNAQGERPRDLSSLRCMFTGGEAVPYERAAQFEETSGAKVLQFYGSNETGLLTGTTTRDTRERRLRTAGQIIEEMEVRLFDPETYDEVTGVGQPACRGPATCLGYWGDEAANAKLYTKDGWMLMGDIVEIDPDGYLRVVGRTSDFIIRGGKNISAPAVEEEVGAYAPVAMVAAVAMPDPVFGERVCVYVVPRPNQTVTLDGIRAHLGGRGVTKEWWPEHLVLVEELPRSSGGKVAKGELGEDIRRRLAAEGGPR